MKASTRAHELPKFSRKRPTGVKKGKSVCVTCKHKSRDLLEGALLTEPLDRVSRAAFINSKSLRNHLLHHMTSYTPERKTELRAMWKASQRQRELAREEAERRERARVEALEIEVAAARKAAILERRILDGGKLLTDARDNVYAVIDALRVPLVCPCGCGVVIREPAADQESLDLILKAVGKQIDLAEVQLRVDGRLSSAKLNAVMNVGSTDLAALFASADFIAFRDFLISRVGSCCRPNVVAGLRERAALPPAKGEVEKPDPPAPAQHAHEHEDITLDAEEVEQPLVIDTAAGG